MSTLESFQKLQYNLVKQSRGVLLDYCSTISKTDFIKQVPSFGRGGSIRNLLVHIANTYEFWIGKCCLESIMTFTAYEDIQTIDNTRDLFVSVDKLMEAFLNQMHVSDNKEIEYQISGKTAQSSLEKIFTHVITHEFHHKGQIVSIGRSLAYIPVDTDVMR